MTETILLLETTLDDVTPQLIGYVLELALERGALDAYTAPVQMKKNRPGVLLTILARPSDRQTFLDLLIQETTTLGVRVTPTEREVVHRSQDTVTTPYGEIRIKRSAGRATPEYEDCRAAARRHQVPLQVVIAAAISCS